jgi:acetyl esterase/lipase
VVVHYGEHPEQLADLWLPSTGPAKPLVIFIHGGFWRAEFDRTYVAPLAEDLSERGHPVALIEFRRTGMPGGGWPGTFDDVLAAVRELSSLARLADLGVPHSVGAPIVAGHSAGGHLALWVAAEAGVSVRGVLALAPVADLAQAARLGLDDHATELLLGGSPEQQQQRYAAADPMARPAPAAPTILIHGQLDQQVPVEISRRYAAAKGVTLRELPQVEHFGLIDPLSTAWPTVLAALNDLAAD